MLVVYAAPLMYIAAPQTIETRQGIFFLHEVDDKDDS